jgi:hypothetical protein
VGEHRIDQLAARKQPVPRLLTEPVEVLTPHAVGEAAHRRPRRHRWKRRIMRTVRSKRGRWVLIGLACIGVLIVGLLAQGFFSSPAPALHLPPGAAGGYSTPAPDPLTSSVPAKHHKGGGSGKNLVSNPVQRLHSVLPDNPLNHLRGGQLHEVTISVSTPGHIEVLGYLVPTGMGSSYGEVHTARHTWSMREQAVGSGYLAAMFVQSDKLGSPLTCTVTVDGKVTNSETTSGSYGRAVCLG